MGNFVDWETAATNNLSFGTRWDDSYLCAKQGISERPVTWTARAKNEITLGW